eukprot:Blabericola_migrator_1__2377@NODE_1667_length_4051_cov_30_506275_g1083_i0_p1_GENE_NODE_1667_length_4051_cov_30_506275_g1083_i0NODE_1667_length_4051_cov_30_506275_g1083_i0_p1_ORF_typecomplete_len569_score123_24_NODE_1667_length_4051_cov_30_506275_g1083_i017473453
MSEELKQLILAIPVQTVGEGTTEAVATEETTPAVILEAPLVENPTLETPLSEAVELAEPATIAEPERTAPAVNPVASRKFPLPKRKPAPVILKAGPVERTTSVDLPPSSPEVVEETPIAAPKPVERLVVVSDDWDDDWNYDLKGEWSHQISNALGGRPFALMEDDDFKELPEETATAWLSVAVPRLYHWFNGGLTQMKFLGTPKSSMMEPSDNASTEPTTVYKSPAESSAASTEATTITGELSDMSAGHPTLTVEPSVMSASPTTLTMEPSVMSASPTTLTVQPSVMSASPTTLTVQPSVMSSAPTALTGTAPLAVAPQMGSAPALMTGVKSTMQRSRVGAIPMSGNLTPQTEDSVVENTIVSVASPPAVLAVPEGFPPPTSHESNTSILAHMVTVESPLAPEGALDTLSLSTDPSFSETVTTATLHWPSHHKSHAKLFHEDRLIAEGTHDADPPAQSMHSEAFLVDALSVSDVEGEEEPPLVPADMADFQEDDLIVSSPSTDQESGLTRPKISHHRISVKQHIKPFLEDGLTHHLDSEPPRDPWWSFQDEFSGGHGNLPSDEDVQSH